MDPERRPGASAPYYPYFDWLRLALSCTVLAHHEGLLPEKTLAGDFAVRVFFALSGWLIGGMLLKLKPPDLPRFFFNRIVRIWWSYILAVFLLVAASLSREHISRKWCEFVFYYLTFVYNLFGPRQMWNHRLQMPLAGTGNHFWSVNDVEQFYLLAPVLLVLFPKVGRRVVTWVILAAIAWTSKTYASISLGVLAVVLQQEFGGAYPKVWVRAAAGCIAACAGIGITQGVSYEAAVPFCAVGLVVMLAANGPRHSLGELAGGMSYPLYLNQWTSGFLWGVLLHGHRAPFPRTLFTIPVSFVIAAALYWFSDRPILAMRSKLYTPQRARILMILAYAVVAAGLCVGIALWK